MGDGLRKWCGKGENDAKIMSSSMTGHMLHKGFELVGRRSGLRARQINGMRKLLDSLVNQLV